MTQYNYSMKMENEDNIAKAVGREMEISTKQAIEVCNAIKKKSIDEARKILQAAIEEKKAIKFRRFTGGAGHRKGIGAGKYPVKCCTDILRLLNQAAANASFKGLNPSNMIIKVLVPQRAGNRMHYGRQSRRKMKRTHLEMILEEQKEVKKTEGKKEAKKRTEKKQEVKKE
jgi:large subunit ribosomal protein L22